MSVQRSIDGTSGQGHLGGREGTHGVAAVWVAVRIVAIFNIFRRAAVRAFERVRSAQAGGNKRKQMKLVESLQLGNRRQLLLVVCDNQRYLVGAGMDSVGSILAMEASSVSRDRVARGPELVRRRGRDGNHEARSKIAAEPGLDLWH